MNNQTVRQSLRQKRKALSKSTLILHSKMVLKHLIHFPPFEEATNIAIYFPIHGEIDTADIIDTCWKLNKKVFLPRLLPNFQMCFHPYRQKDTCVKNEFGISEPNNTETINSKHLELVFLPLVAFDEKGHRLGMGLGYYDRHFEFIKQHNRTKPMLIGLAHDFQCRSDFNVNAWDIPMDIVITESGIKKFSQNY